MTGLDGDPEILSIARRKSLQHELSINFEQGLSYDIPYQDNRFDRCLSSPFFHHLTLENKQKTLHEIFRVLKQGGKIHIADWGEPTNALMSTLFYQIQLLDGFATTASNKKGVIPELLKIAGFEDVSVVEELSTIFGTMTLYRANKPEQVQD